MLSLEALWFTRDINIYHVLVIGDAAADRYLRWELAGRTQLSVNIRTVIILCVESYSLAWRLIT